MLFASVTSLRHDIHGLRSIGVQQKFPWQCMGDGEHSALRSTSVLAANGMDKHAACGTAWSPPTSGVHMAH
jgi:hypothetical protein